MTFDEIRDPNLRATLRSTSDPTVRKLLIRERIDVLEAAVKFEHVAANTLGEPALAKAREYEDEIAELKAAIAK